MSFEFDQSDRSCCDSDMVEDIYSSEEDANKSFVLSKEKGDEKLSKNARKRKKRREKLNRLEKSKLAHKSSEEEDDDDDDVKREHLKKYSDIGTCCTSRWLFKLILVLFIIGAGLGLTYFWTNNTLLNLNAEDKAEDNLKGQPTLSDDMINDQLREEVNAYVEQDTFHPLEESRIQSESDSQALEVNTEDEIKPYDYSWLSWWTREEESAKSEETLERSERADIVENENEQAEHANNLEQSEPITKLSSDESQDWFSDLHKKSQSQFEDYTIEQRYSDFDQPVDSEQLEQARILTESLAREEEEANRLRQEATTLEETKREEEEFSECFKIYEGQGENIDECKARKISNNQRNDKVSSTQSSSPSISMDPNVMPDIYDEDLYYW